MFKQRNTFSSTYLMLRSWPLVLQMGNAFDYLKFYWTTSLERQHFKLNQRSQFISCNKCDVTQLLTLYRLGTVLQIEYHFH